MAVTAQETVILKFTSTTPSGSYYPFDVVNVTNVTRGWTESLTYPDTTMVLSTLTGLDENFDNGGFLSEVYPNPLSGTANVMFGMKQPGIINAKVLSINGSVLSEYNDFLEAGLHQITFNLNEPQMAFLVVKTNDNQYIKKILNISCGDDNSIAINKIADEIKYTKERTIGDFEIGDVMSYMAVSFYGGNMIESQRITQAQNTDETLTLLFNVTSNPVPPTVTTSVVTNITNNSAVAGGNVTSDGGATITERGVCCSTDPNSTTSGSHISASTAGTGSFTCQLTELTPGTTYYVRAYAVNSQGYSYGNLELFNTPMTLPTVVTNQISDVTIHSAFVEGCVTDEGGGTVSERGFCWSTNQNPTLNDSHVECGNGTGVFEHIIGPLESNTSYYVRAYATNQVGTSYGALMTITTTQVNVPTGAIEALFSVSETQQVFFSQGNLQYRASTNTWRFANNQYDYIGESNANKSPYYNGWIDLIGWGTSGYNHGAICYQPWSISTNTSDYWAYGNESYNLYDGTGMADWGYNAISNGGNQENCGWRTLTWDEWDYLISIRNTPSGIRYAKAIVDNVEGLILLPDDWSIYFYDLNNTNDQNASFNSNIISTSQWIYLEQCGVVFLPRAGRLTGSTYDYPFYSIYWASTAYYSYNEEGYIGSGFSFGPDVVYVNGVMSYAGRSVRLVRQYN